MKGFQRLLQALTLLPLFTQQTFAAKEVFAHFMHGLTASYNQDTWTADINAAKAAGIDGFALNIGPTDAWTETQLDNAYAVADKLGFKMLISFDQLCCGTWEVEHVSRLINKYKGRPSQFKVGDKPFVSTFEGTNFIEQWAQVRSQTGGIYLVPDWASLGPDGFKQHVGKVEGAFAWDAWSITPKQKDTNQDKLWKERLGPGKAYMMAVSPWFYTNLPQYNKNWMWKGDSLWYTRWEQVLDIMPDFVEIITWNDYGESHYISPIRGESIVAGANKYVDGMPHDGWRFILPYYIAAYKAGNRNVPVQEEGVAYWYRKTPMGACADGGTTCSPPGYPAQYKAAECSEDAVFVTSLATEPSDVEVSIGGAVVGTGKVGKGAGFFSANFGGKTGPVKVRLLRNGKEIAAGTGTSIDAQCNNGIINWNAWVGVARAGVPQKHRKLRLRDVPAKKAKRALTVPRRIHSFV
ncbi:putative alpha 1,3-glucanase, GH71 family [Peziza echinospora]|nr:putative alpha 1,3-glucanase, GH71 family [Peziza echinospora]